MEKRIDTQAGPRAELDANHDAKRAERIELEPRVAELEIRTFDLNARFDSLQRQVTETEIRLSTAIHGLAGTLNDVKTLLHKQLRRRPPDKPS